MQPSGLALVILHAMRMASAPDLAMTDAILLPSLETFKRRFTGIFLLVYWFEEANAYAFMRRFFGGCLWLASSSGEYGPNAVAACPREGEFDAEGRSGS